MARDNLYSKAVVWVKVTLPLIALGLLSSLFLLSGSPDPDAALPYAAVDIDEIIREQRVTAPRFAGVLGEGQELVLTAEAVSADPAMADRIQAQAIEGRMDLTTTEFLTLTSAMGDFDMAAQMATLTDGVSIQTSEGFRLDGDSLLLALDRVHISAQTPVHVTGPGLDLTADTMDFSGPEGETILRFTGSVRMVYDPQS